MVAVIVGGRDVEVGEGVEVSVSVGKGNEVAVCGEAQEVRIKSRQ